MHVLYSKDPDRCQIGKEIRTFDEVTRVRPDRHVIAQGENMRMYLIRHGFAEVTDELLDAREAAEILGVPVPVVNSWARLGKLNSFSDQFLRADVERLASEREADSV